MHNNGSCMMMNIRALFAGSDYTHSTVSHISTGKRADNRPNYTTKHQSFLGVFHVSLIDLFKASHQVPEYEVSKCYLHGDKRIQYVFQLRCGPCNCICYVWDNTTGNCLFYPKRQNLLLS